MDEHHARVSVIAKRIKVLQEASIPFRIYHGSTNSTRPSSRTYANTIDISAMNHVLNIKPDAKTCLVEPSVPMDALITMTLQHNLVPPVVPEFPGITVGGAYAGTAGESSSFRHGFFDDCVNWLEIILGDGEVIEASRSQNSKLFHGAKGTFGTLGVGTLFELQLVEAKQFVEVTYITITGGITEASEILLRECLKDSHQVDFVDGIMFTRDTGLVIIGKMVDQPEIQKSEGKKRYPVVQTFSKPQDPWFYLHAQTILNSSLKGTTKATATAVAHQELIPLKDYLFRYDRGGFWTGHLAFKYFHTPFNRITRRLLDRFMYTRTMYHALHRSGLIEKFIIQDIAVPWNNIEALFTWLDRNLGIYPLWLAPLKLSKGGIRFDPQFTARHSESGASAPFVLNIGLWGRCPKKDSLKINRAIEAKLADVGGMKWLYSQTFYTEDEFWSIYDREWYNDLRALYKANSLPDVYEKVGGNTLNHQRNATAVGKLWPFAGILGVLSTLKGKDYLRKR